MDSTSSQRMYTADDFFSAGRWLSQYIREYIESTSADSLCKSELEETTSK